MLPLSSLCETATGHEGLSTPETDTCISGGLGGRGGSYLDLESFSAGLTAELEALQMDSFRDRGE